MTVTRIFLLLLCVFILVLVLATIFKRYQRIILWSAAIVIFTGTLFLMGLGIIDPVTDNRPDSVVITGVAFAFFFSGALAYGAEKLRAKNREKEKQTIQTKNNQPEEQDVSKGVVLSGRLDTPLALSLQRRWLPDIWKRMVPIIGGGKARKPFLPICAAEYIAVIFLNTPNWIGSHSGNSATDFFQMPS